MNVDIGNSREALVRALERVEADVRTFFSSLSDRDFITRVGDAWSPAEHLQHLSTSVSAVARGLAAPKLILRLRFGGARRQSRSYLEIRRDYLDRLRQGGRATGRFVPPPEDPGPADAATRRRAILERWSRVNQRLRAALASWTDRDLDRVQMPHPLLGRLTTREMLFFTIYHGCHHVEAASRRLPR